MTIGVQWKVKTLIVLPEVGGMTDYVYQVNWVCEAKDASVLSKGETEIVFLS